MVVATERSNSHFDFERKVPIEKTVETRGANRDEASAINGLDETPNPVPTVPRDENKMVAPFDTIHGPHFAPVETNNAFPEETLSNSDPITNAEDHRGTNKNTPTVNFNVLMGTTSSPNDTEKTSKINFDNTAATDEVHADPGGASVTLSTKKHDNSPAI